MSTRVEHTTTPRELETCYARYKQAEITVLQFMEAHGPLFQEYSELLSLRNESLNQLRGLIHKHRERLPKRWREFVISVPTEIDVEELGTKIGDEQLVKLGILKPTMVFDRKAYDRAVDDGSISVSVDREVTDTGSPRIKGPTTFDIPIVQTEEEGA